MPFSSLRYTVQRGFEKLCDASLLRTIVLPRSFWNLYPIAVYPDTPTSKYSLEADLYKSHFKLSQKEVEEVDQCLANYNHQDRVFIKVYDINEMYDYFNRHREFIGAEFPEIRSEEQFSAHLLTQKFFREIEINRIILEYNDSCTDEASKIHAPRMLSYGTLARDEVFFGLYICFEHYKISQTLTMKDFDAVNAEVEKLHKLNITHGNVLDNLTVQEDGTVQIYDFSIARIVPEDPTDYTNRMYYIWRDLLQLIELKAKLEVTGECKNSGKRFP